MALRATHNVACDAVFQQMRLDDFRVELFGVFPAFATRTRAHPLCRAALGRAIPHTITRTVYGMVIGVLDPSRLMSSRVISWLSELTRTLRGGNFRLLINTSSPSKTPDRMRLVSSFSSQTTTPNQLSPCPNPNACSIFLFGTLVEMFRESSMRPARVAGLVRFQRHTRFPFTTMRAPSHAPWRTSAFSGLVKGSCSAV